MQVSWIDPEEIRDLLAKIEGPLPRPAANNFAWELNTLPLVPMEPLPADTMIDGPELTQKTATPPPPSPSEFPMSEGSGPASGDLWRIREKLRSLREQAQESGILPRGEESAPEADQPSAPVEPPPVPEATASMSSVVEELVAEFTATIQAAPQPSPPQPFPDVGVEPFAFEAAPALEPSRFLPSPPPVTHKPVGPSPPPPVGPMTIEYAGPAPDGPEYEPLFSHGAPPSFPPLPSPPEEAAPSLAEVPVPEPIVSPFSIAEPVAEPEPELAAESEKPAFVVPPLGLSDRLSALAQWAADHLGTSEVLLVDDYGDVLWGGHSQTPLVLSAMMAWHAAQRSTAESACSEPHRIDKDLANGRALTVLPARTRYGVVSLAAIQEKPMTPFDEQAIRAALVLAVEGTEPA